MKTIRILSIMLIGGGLGLLAVPLLPQQGQDRIAAWQGRMENLADDVSKSFRSIEDAKSASPTSTPTTLDTLKTTSTPTSVSTSDITSRIAKLVHQLVNKERQSQGRPSLRQDERLSAIARTHSLDMAEKDYFAHENLLGQGPSERAAQWAYICRKDYGSYYTEGVAENIYQNWLYSSITYVGPIPIKSYSSVEEIATSTVTGWMESPGHRQNIMDPAFDRVGTGVAVSQDEKSILPKISANIWRIGGAKYRYPLSLDRAL